MVTSSKFWLRSLLAGIWLSSLMGQFWRWDSPWGKMSLHELLMGIFILLTSLLTFRELPRLIRQLPHWSLVGLGFLGWSIGITAFRSWQLRLPLFFWQSLAYLGRMGLYAAFASFVWLVLTKKWLTWRQLSWGIMSWLVLQASIGIGQYLLLPDTRMFEMLGWDDHLSRAFGTLFDPGFFGATMAIGSIWFLIQEDQASRKSWTLLGFCWLLLALALSFSRAAYVAYGAGILMLAGKTRVRRWLLFIPLLVMALVLLPKDGGGEGQRLARTQSVKERVEVTQQHSRKLRMDELILGRGWAYQSALQLRERALAEATGKTIAEFTSPQNAQFVDSSYLHIIFATGLLGTVLFSCMLFLWWKNISPESQILFTPLLIHGFFSTSLFYSWLMLLSGTLLVLSETRYNEKHAHRFSSRSPASPRKAL